MTPRIIRGHERTGFMRQVSCGRKQTNDIDETIEMAEKYAAQALE